MKKLIQKILRYMAYARMAKDKEREAAALEWSEALISDSENTMR